MTSARSFLTHRTLTSLATTLLLVAGVSSRLAAQAPQPAAQRPMTFLDVQEFARPGAWTPSPDGQWMLYTIATPDWQQAESQIDIHLVSMTQGVASNRQMTFTAEKDETSPQWSRDGRFFVFASNRDASDGDDHDQLFFMRPDGGEARRITDAEEGIRDFAFSLDGGWLAYRSGEAGLEQLYRLPVADIFSAEAEQVTDGSAGVEDWEWARDSRSIYFTRPDSHDEDDALRREQEFTVDVKKMETPLSNLWVVDLTSGASRQLTSDPAVSVTGFSLSDDGRWITFTGGSAERYACNITASRLYADQYLFEIATGYVEPLTNNDEAAEGGLGVSPDGRWVAFSAPDDMTRYTMTENRVYSRDVTDRGGAFRKLGEAFDGSLSVGFWSDAGNTIYFNAGVTVTTQLHAVDVRTGDVRQVTNERAALRVSRDDDSGAILINYSDPTTPPTVFTVSSLDQMADRSAWIQLVDANPQVAEMALGEETEITWRSTDGKLVGAFWSNRSVTATGSAIRWSW